MSTNSEVQLEILEALVRVYHSVRNALVVYGQRRDPNELDHIVYQVTKLYRLAKLVDVATNDVLEEIGCSLSILEEIQSSSMLGNGTSPLELQQSCGYKPSVLIGENMVGRPRLDIPKEQLEYLLSMGFSGPQISTAIGVSLSTIRRRMTEYGLSIGSLYSDVTDEELDQVVSEIKVLFPNSGYRMMQGHLLNHGYRVAQARIQDSLQRVDSDGVVIRWSAAIERRRYRVKSPLSLWHLDGNHKIIR